jgi:hypothetical protein
MLLDTDSHIRLERLQNGFAGVLVTSTSNSTAIPIAWK